MAGHEIYRTVKSLTEGSYREKGSRFLAFVIPCPDPAAAKAEISVLRKQHPNAVHVCFAWRFGKKRYEDRFSDDGEPANSAGKPIFGQILAYDITNVLIAVVRYYGGTNLGVGGLINAYRTAVTDALEKAIIEEHYISDHFLLRYPFELTGEALNRLQKAGVEIHTQRFDENGPSVEFSIRQSHSAMITEEFTNNKNYVLTRSGSDQ